VRVLTWVRFGWKLPVKVGQFWMEINTDTPNAEQNSPWSLDDRTKIGFATLPHNPADAVAKLRSLVMQVVVPAAWPARA
ncbi:hypothetical protein, partial [Hydrogenophaga defluvii]